MIAGCVKMLFPAQPNNANISRRHRNTPLNTKTKQMKKDYTQQQQLTNDLKYTRFCFWFLHL